MTILRTPPTIRPAVPNDYSHLSHLINFEGRIHRHLDWKPPLDWLPSQPFLIAETQGILHAALACPPDPPGIAWIRFFGAGGPFPALDYFLMLIDSARRQLDGSAVIAAIALQDWFAQILDSSGFTIHQHIVVLEWNNHLPAIQPLPEEINIRPMEPDDLIGVCEVDKTAFEPLWHNSLDGLRLAYQQSSWSTVAEDNQGIVGYQISTAVPLSGHLARLAVRPGLQRGGIGSGLVVELLRHFQHDGAWRVTVNTQDDNHASLALYERLGFRRTGDIFPVFIDQVAGSLPENH